MIKVKVSKNIGLLKGKDASGKEDFDNIFYNLNENGTEVELNEKDLAYVKVTLKRFEKSQKILEKAVQKVNDV